MALELTVIDGFNEESQKAIQRDQDDYDDEGPEGGTHPSLSIDILHK